jgi:hypothetical protein
LSFQPLIFSQPAVFFSHNKSANSIFSRLFLAKRTGMLLASGHKTPQHLKNHAHVCNKTNGHVAFNNKNVFPILLPAIGL